MIVLRSSDRFSWAVGPGAVDHRAGTLVRRRPRCASTSPSSRHLPAPLGRGLRYSTGHPTQGESMSFGIPIDDKGGLRGNVRRLPRFAVGRGNLAVREGPDDREPLEAFTAEVVR